MTERESQSFFYPIYIRSVYSYYFYTITFLPRTQEQAQQIDVPCLFTVSLILLFLIREQIPEHPLRGIQKLLGDPVVLCLVIGDIADPRLRQIQYLGIGICH